VTFKGNNDDTLNGKRGGNMSSDHPRRTRYRKTWPGNPHQLVRSVCKLSQNSDLAFVRMIYCYTTRQLSRRSRASISYQTFHRKARFGFIGSKKCKSSHALNIREGIHNGRVTVEIQRRRPPRANRGVPCISGVNSWARIALPGSLLSEHMGKKHSMWTHSLCTLS